MGLISDLAAFMQMDETLRYTIIQTLVRCSNATLDNPYNHLLRGIEISVKDSDTPKTIVRRYLHLNDIHLPTLLEKDINWPKMLDTLVKYQYIILVKPDTANQEEEKK